MSDRAELVDELERLVYIAWRVDPGRAVTWRDGRAVIDRTPPASELPAVASAEWWESPARVRIAALVLLAQEYLRLVDELKAAAVAISEERQRQRELIRRRRDAIGEAFRAGDTARAIALTEHHAGNDWHRQHPRDSVAS